MSRVKQGRIPAFKERFNKLSERFSTKAAFADYLGLSVQSVGFWLNGDRVPDAANLMVIRDKMGVSIDWLLGYEDVDKPKADTTVRLISDYTGLSHDSIGILHFLQENNREDGLARKTLLSLDRLLRDELFYIDILHSISSFFEYSDKINLDNQPVEDYYSIFSDEDYRMVRAFEQKGFVVQSVRQVAQQKAESIGTDLTEYLKRFTEKLPAISEIEEKSRQLKSKTWHNYIVDSFYNAQDDREEAQQHGNDDKENE